MKRLIAGAAMIAIAAGSDARQLQPRFFDDDPIVREPETRDASRVEPWDIYLLVDLATNLFGRPGDPASDVRARNINTIDEVPDSNWFTNRILARPLSRQELERGPLTGDGPAPGVLTVMAPKTEGFAPGFTVRDTRGERWFVSFDANGFPDAATGAIAVATRLFWALGYWQSENHLVAISPEQLILDPAARFRPPSGRMRQMRRSDVDDVLRRSHRRSDGTYRAIAARALPGRILGGFRYYGTRPDDPNDVVPHEHRRELRALKVFGAWTNLVDMKASNTLDTVIEENGKHVVRHYLQDVGSTFGTGANGPREYDEGWEYLFDPGPTKARLLSFGFKLAPWHTVKFNAEQTAVGRFEGARFDPDAWRPRAPTAAFHRARGDDCFWAARRVAAFTDDKIRTIVRAGEYNPAAEELLAQVLIQRRDRIVSRYLNGINPLVDFALSPSGALEFANAAVDAGVAAEPGGGYQADWARFDNATRVAVPIGETRSSGTRFAALQELPATPGSYVQIRIAAARPAPAPWLRPVTVHFRRNGAAWKLVGVERLP
jgi:hypothetical protein